MQHINILPTGATPKRILALGAHADDIEIGCGGTILRLVAEHPELEVLWVVLSSTPTREAEARASAAAFLEGVARSTVMVMAHRDGYLPYVGAAVKEDFERLKARFSPDLIFTHFRRDLHQDHRLVSELTWNTWRDHLILEYEIPKYDGDLDSPNVFCTLPSPVLEQKVALILEHFASQAGKHWLTPDLLQALPRLRGMECVAPDGLAEGFYCRKAVF